MNNHLFNRYCPSPALFAVAFTLLTAQQARAAFPDHGQPPRPVTALCTDLRTQAADPAAPGILSHYSGQEIVTQIGDQVTVQYLPDRLTGFSGAVVSYERITRGDASQLGFKVETGMAVYMLHGDEELPSEYVVLPEHMAEISSARFQAYYGACNEAGEYDSEHVTTMSCVLR